MSTEQYTVANVRVLRCRFGFAETVLPAVPAIESCLDEYVLTQPDGAPLPGTTGQRPARRSVVNPRPSELAAGWRPIGDTLAGLLNSLLADIVAAVGAAVTPAEIVGPDGAVRERYDRLVLEGGITLTLAFGGDWTADLPRSLVAVSYRRENAAGQRFLPTETLERRIGPDGWNLDLTRALRAMAVKVVELRHEEGVR